MNTKGQQLSINFLVKFILAIVLFGMGVALMWNIFNHGTGTLDISQQEFDRRISALNCKPSETVCIGSNKLEMESGESVLVELKLFNNHNVDNTYDISYEFRDGTDEPFPSDEFQLLPPFYKDETIGGKDSKDFSIYLKTSKHLPEGDYAIRVLVTPDSTEMAPIPKRIYVTVS